MGKTMEINQENITETFIKVLLDQYFVDITQDPKRSIRRLVDLGERSSVGRFQKFFYQMMQEMGRNTESPYYTLITNLVNNADWTTIKTFGINLGLHSWTVATRNIRKRQDGSSVPWSVLIHLNDSTIPTDLEVLHDLVTDGRNNSVFTYVFQCDGNGDTVLDPIVSLCDKYPDCAFVISSPANNLSAETVSAFCKVHNLMTLVNTDYKGWEASCTALKQGKGLFGVSRKYGDDASTSEITSCRWIQEILPYDPLFAVCFASADCTPENAVDVKDLIYRIRVNQEFPIMMMDYYYDTLEIQRIISNENYFIGIKPNGVVTSCNGYKEI